MKAIIDWLQFTILPAENSDAEPETPESIIFHKLHLLPSDFKQRKGLYWYKNGLEHENISVFYDGMNEGMGIHVQMSGKGCRYYETKENFSWQMFFTYLLRENVQFTRVDVAIDDTEWLDMENIKFHLEKGLVSTRFKDYSYRNDYKFQDNKKISDTIYFGTRSSDVFMRIYNKSMESDGKINSIRFETVMKHKRAQSFITEYCNPENFFNLANLAGQVINNYIRFISEKKGNSTRSVTAKWWLSFIETTEKLSLSTGKEDITMEKVCTWFEKQVAGGLKLLYETKGEDYTKGVIQKARLNSKHQRLKSRYVIELQKAVNQ